MRSWFLPVVRRQRRSAAVAAVGAITVGLLAGCGQPTAQGHGQFSTPTADGGGTAAAVSLTPAAVTFAPGAPTVALNPVTYPLGDPCATGTGFDITAPEMDSGRVSRLCFNEWLSMGITYLPGQGLMTGAAPASVYPHTAIVGAGVTPDEARAVGTGFVRDQAFTAFALLTGQQGIDQMLSIAEPHNTYTDAFAVAFKRHATFTVPQCATPIAMRVERLDPAALSYIQNTGWSTAGPLAVVVTFPPCNGITAVYSDGSHTLMPNSANSIATRVIVTGQLQTVDPMGSLFLVTGEGLCADRALSAACS